MPVHLFEAAELSEVAPGVYRTPEVEAMLPAQRLVASYNPAHAEAGPVTLALRGQVAAGWSGWYPVSTRPGVPPPPPESGPPGLRLAADELVSEADPFVRGQVEVRAAGGPPRRVGLCFWPVFGAVALPEGEVEPGELPARVVQYSVSETEGHRVCGPSSLTMALRGFGVDADPRVVAAAVKDPVAGIYGNWTHLAAYAGERGLAAWVERGAGPAGLGAHLAAGRWVILSLSWAEHELPGAPIPASDGHLVLAVGYDQAGVLCLDPAHKDPAVQATRYPWPGVLRAWKSGAAIVLGPEDISPPVA